MTLNDFWFGHELEKFLTSKSIGSQREEDLSSKGDADLEQSVKSSRDATLIREKDYQAIVQNRNRWTLSISISLAILSIALGASPGIYDGQLLGLGLFILILSFLFRLWEFCKSLYLEHALGNHNRILTPAYRDLRIAICATVLIMLIRAIYIMTIAALTSIIVDFTPTAGNLGDFVFACIMVGPVTLSLPLGVAYYSIKFREKYIIG